MDSIYKGYPVGSVLLWRTRSRLKTERKLGVFELPPPDKDYPVDYVLDGQQRLTSIFTTFQTTLEAARPTRTSGYPSSMTSPPKRMPRISQFVVVEFPPPSKILISFFPLAAFFQPVEFGRLTRSLTDDRTEEIARFSSAFSFRCFRSRPSRVRTAERGCSCSSV